MYVDDVICGADTEREAYELYEQSGGFNLRKFVSSSPKLQQDIDRQEGIVESTTEDDTYARSTLGRSSTPGTYDIRSIVECRQGPAGV